jgi:hypothetical protein
MTEDYSKRTWIHLYAIAMMDLQHAITSGRMIDTSGEIVRRIEILKGIPGLNQDERRAIADVLEGLRSLAKQGSQQRSEQQRRAAQLAIDKLSSIAPMIARLKGVPSGAGSASDKLFVPSQGESSFVSVLRPAPSDIGRPRR